MKRPALSNLGVFLAFEPYFRPHRGRIARWFALYGAYFLAGILTPYAFKAYIDDVLPGPGRGRSACAWCAALGLRPSPEAALGTFCGAYLLYAAGLQALNYWGALGTTRIIEDVVAELRASLFEKLHRLQLRFFDRTLGGEIVNQVTTDTRQLLNLLGGELINVSLSAFMGAVSLAILACWNPRLAAIVAAFLPAYAWLFRRFLPRVHRAARAWRVREDRLWGNWGEKLRGMAVIRAFIRERGEALRHYGLGRASADSWTRMTLEGAAMGSWGGFVAGLSSQAAYAAGCVLVYDRALSLGELVTLTGFITFILAPVQGAFNLVNTWQQSAVSARRVLDLLREAEEDPERHRKRRLTSLRGAVAVEGLRFSYVPGRPVLKGLDLSVEPGERVALVGRTGCGKTTLVQLILGFYPAESGRVLLDGIPLGEIDARTLRRFIGVVPQELTLFSATVRANVAYGRPDAPDAEVWAALEAAQIADYVRSLPRGLDCPLGADSGAAPSRGQGQRLAVARALLIDPRVVVLDEATSALDSLEEARMQRAVDRLLEGRTALIIAHRLSTLRRCHRVVVLEDGRVAEQGPPEDLLRSPDGAYARLARAHAFGDAP